MRQGKITDTNLLTIAREEYTNKLCSKLSPLLYNGLKSVWDNVKISKKEKVLMSFQEQLCMIPKWNSDIIETECKRIDGKCNMVQLEKLLEAIFLFNIKILSAISSEKQIDVSIPEIKNFIHKCYINCARELYMNPYLMDDRNDSKKIDNIKIQKNTKTCMKIIDDSISKTVKDCIPIEQILEQYLSVDNDNYSDNVQEQEPKLTVSNGDNILNAEIDTEDPDINYSQTKQIPVENNEEEYTDHIEDIEDEGDEPDNEVGNQYQEGNNIDINEDDTPEPEPEEKQETMYQIINLNENNKEEKEKEENFFE
jgi:hypothetical protein